MPTTPERLAQIHRRAQFADRLYADDVGFLLSLIDEAADIGIPALKFNFRGESVLHPDYGDIVEYAAGKIVPVCDGAFECQDGYCTCGSRPAFHDLLANTNGNIPDNRWESSIRGLMACTKVMVSLDSMDAAIYPKVRI